MRALICNEFAPLEALRVGDLPEPRPAAGEVTIRVCAAGINFYDTLIVQGKYQVKPPFPFSPGGEVAGEVVAVGEGVSHVRPGDRVCAFTSYGGYAQVCRTKASQTWPLPEAVPFDAAAAGLVTYGTAWFGLHDRARMKAGETVLVLGAAGGVGLAAVQIAKAAGARVIAAAGSAERLALCREHGADDLIDYTTTDLKDAVKAATGGNGADIVVDVVGGAYTEAALRATAWRGRILIIGFAAGEIPRIPANLLLLKGCDMGGVFWDELMRREPAEAARQVAAVLACFADGSLKPPITRACTLDGAVAAMQALAARQVAGKLIVLPQD
ncbi:NADPH:quinone oxidoreductase family protein [Azoarcus sp. L1K30]|uniref:NADPH:quinone oxidoreductase family protein n=1 Tax=Azoarcus sp. L1K30 TaxID=2820277 RepID=UPI001B81E367|nr:NADPH:quinone oxidoreductase family protein [Azoarcus sp. L1K30]MBR0568947.1 NADPH:quinone oxidoreductase family protein [Azoarcus sp. L1K30]